MLSDGFGKLEKGVEVEIQGSEPRLRRAKILLIAESANPEWTSVPLIGWNLSRALARHADVHLVTQIRNRGALLRHGLVEGVDFTAIDNERLAAQLIKIGARLRGGEGKGWTTISAFSALAYYSFERKLWERFGARLSAGEFDLVHRITPLSPTNASPIAKRLADLNIPFVLGPLNGGVPWPSGFRHRQHEENEWLSYVRNLFRFMPGYSSTRRNSAAILVGSKYTQSEMPSWAADKCIYMPENGIDEKVFRSSRRSPAFLPLKAIFVGRLVPYKGADMAIVAAAELLRAGSLKLQIVGDGPQMARLISLAKQLGVEENVQFGGWLTQEDLQRKLGECDVLVFPSIREFGGGVVLEAMALGVAPIVADYGGPSELVDEHTGMRVAFADEASLIEGVKCALQRMVAEPESVDRLGAAARDRVLAQFTWDAKARKIIEIYHELLDRGSVRALTG